MAPASLASYDETAGIRVDTNVWVDCIDEASPWHSWPTEQLHACSEWYPLHVNIIIYSELRIPGPDVGAVNAMLDIYETLRTPLPWAAASLTAAAYATYRCRDGAKQKLNEMVNQPELSDPTQILKVITKHQIAT